MPHRRVDQIGQMFQQPCHFVSVSDFLTKEQPNKAKLNVTEYGHHVEQMGDWHMLLMCIWCVCVCDMCERERERGRDTQTERVCACVHACVCVCVCARARMWV